VDYYPKDGNWTFIQQIHNNANLTIQKMSDLGQIIVDWIKEYVSSGIIFYYEDS
jgi:hypothetical protein